MRALISTRELIKVCACLTQFVCFVCVSVGGGGLLPLTSLHARAHTLKHTLLSLHMLAQTRTAAHASPQSIAESCVESGDPSDVCVCREPSPGAEGACAALTHTPPDDVVCSGECSGGACTCAVMFNVIDPETSCTDVCESSNMDCVGRNGDGGRSYNRACEWYYTGAQVKSCDVKGDNDDVCVCRERATSGPSDTPAVPPTHSPTNPLPTAAPTAAPTNAPTFSPASLPTLPTVIAPPPTTPAPTESACSAVPRSSSGTGPYADRLCLDQCTSDAFGVSTCVCAASIRRIPTPSGSCTSMCQLFGMTCVGRHSDGPSYDRCRYYNLNRSPTPSSEFCDATGDNDDVCICQKVTLP
jgi:hypothetical protein